MNHVRCAECRNPVRSRQRRVEHARAHMVFHEDCWRSLHERVQQSYAEAVTVPAGARGVDLDQRVDALLAPYQRAEMATWLPEAAIEEAAAAWAAHIVELEQQGAAPEPEEPETVTEAPAREVNFRIVEQTRGTTSPTRAR